MCCDDDDFDDADDYGDVMNLYANVHGIIMLWGNIKNIIQEGHENPKCIQPPFNLRCISAIEFLANSTSSNICSIFFSASFKCHSLKRSPAVSPCFLCSWPHGGRTSDSDVGSAINTGFWARIAICETVSMDAEGACVIGINFVLSEAIDLTKQPLSR